MTEIFKKVKIHTGVVKRINKEKVSYEKEYNKEMEKIQKMKDNCDAGDEEMKANIKKQEEVSNETKSMVPDAERRLRENVMTLKNYMCDIKVPEDQWSEDQQVIIKNAREILEEVKGLV